MIYNRINATCRIIRYKQYREIAMIEELIEDLLNDLEIDKSEISKQEGHTSVPIDDELWLHFKELNEQGLQIKAEISECPERKLEEFYTSIMQGNLFGTLSGGAVLALDESGKKLTMNLTIAYNPSYSDFYGEVERFVNYVDYWKKQVQEHEKACDQSQDLFH